MATIKVVQGDDASFRAMTYGYDRHPGTINYIQNSINDVVRHSNILTNYASEFFSNAAATSESLIGERAILLAKASLARVNNIFVQNDIHYIGSMEEIQNAPLIMQRYIMAMPELRQLYHNQLCDGYSNTYVDNNPGDIGETHYDYRRVMNGIVVSDEYEDKVTFYLDELLEGDRELFLSEQSNIKHTWEIVAQLIKYDIDPTDSFR